MKALIILPLLPLQLLSQDITGIWTGFMETRGNNLPYELVISENNEKITGYALTIFTINGIDNIGIKSIKVKKKDGYIIIEDVELIYNNYVTLPKRLKQLSTLNVDASSMTLSGDFQTRSLDFRSQDNSYSGTIILKRQNVNVRTRLINKLDELNLLSGFAFILPEIAKTEQIPSTSIQEERSKTSTPIEKDTVVAKSLTVVETKPQNVKVTVVSSPPAKKLEAVPKIAAAEIATRKTEIIRSVFFNSDSILLSLYDNGVVDGDTVSVVLNGKVIIARKELTTKPLKTVIHTTPDFGDSLQLVMYAENMGSIPPNTGLLFIQDGANRYEIRFEGDMKRSSSIILRRKR